MAKKQDVSWVEKAPQRNCGTCARMARYGDYNEKFKCDEHGWATKSGAICKTYSPSFEVEP